MKAIIKYNSGHLAILCSGCSKILKVGYEFNQQEADYSKGKINYMPPYYCKTCNESLEEHAEANSVNI
jgi:hypothetical protein